MFSTRTHRGFTLIEIMVGLAIGMIGLIVIMQVSSLAEGQKRSTTGAGDAQTTGAIALFGLQADVRQAGYGVSEVRLVGCNVLLRTGVTLNTMAPVTINHASIPAGDANTDTLLVVYGNGNGTPQGDGVTASLAASVTTYPIQTPSSFFANDRIIGLPGTRPSPCNLTLDTVTAIVPATPPATSITVANGVALALPYSGTATSNSIVYNLGQAPKIVAYAIRNRNLTMCDYMVNDCASVGNVANTAIWTPVANNIASMRAQYGRDTDAPMNAIVDTYDQTTPTTACDWAKVSSIRVALVARNTQYEKTVVTAAAPTWAGSTVNTSTLPTNPTAVSLDLSKKADGTADPDWQNYRYKVFQTVVPLRNISWLGAQTGC